MACRSMEKGSVARDSILQQYPGADVTVEPLDVSSLDSVRQFAERISGRIDLLVNNAGVMAIPRETSVDGYELQLATNHLGHFLLTGLLLPKLRDTAGSRVVAVSSIAARKGEIDFEDLMGEQRYDPWKAYSQSKLANLMFGLELQRRLQQSGAQTDAIVAHPGMSSTSLYATPGGGLVKRLLKPLMERFMFHSAEAGAQCILFAATSPDAKAGHYYGPANKNEMKGPPAEAAIPPQATDEAVAARLWQVSEELTSIRYPDS
jgi:NAD(P)-dependent dehydrogenase (short-subunit alcohol dehydrogenase family)